MKIEKFIFFIILFCCASCHPFRGIPKASRTPPISETASSALPASSTSTDATAIVKNSDDLIRGNSIQGIYVMNISTPQWQRELKLQVYSLEKDKMFIRILSPEKESGIGTLRIKNEMWNYLPRVEKLIKIPPSVMMQPWMGSDFNNDDLVKESSIVNDYSHSILMEEEIEGRMTYKIELRPKPGAPVVWGKIFRWVSKDGFIPMKEEYYNEKGKLIKVLDYSDVEKVSDRVIPRTWKMTSLIEKGHTTTITIIEANYNTPIDESVFTLTNLRNI